jgi:hypothetical protein
MLKSSCGFAHASRQLLAIRSRICSAPGKILQRFTQFKKKSSGFLVITDAEDTYGDVRRLLVAAPAQERPSLLQKGFNEFGIGFGTGLRRGRSSAATSPRARHTAQVSGHGSPHYRITLGRCRRNS